MSAHRSALRYLGGKYKIALKIIRHFPSHICYVEPYGGGASTLLRKPPAPIEVYNDLNGQVVAFFQVLRDRPEELIHAIDLTPYSRQEYELALKPANNPLEQARRLYTRCQGWGRVGASNKRQSWRYTRDLGRKPTIVQDWDNTTHLQAIARRLKNVQIENDDALVIIPRYDTPETLFYIDPPYPHETRGPYSIYHPYQCDLDTKDHRNLALALNKITGMAVVSGRHCQLYDNLYSTWESIDIATTECNGRHGSRRATDTLWLSPSITRQRSTMLPGINAVTVSQPA